MKLDFKFNICQISYDIAYGLERYDFPGLEFQLTPFYNGRERWLCLTVSCEAAFLTPALYIIFGENRNSDDICIQWWRGVREMNPATINHEGFDEKSYNERIFIPFNDYIGAVAEVVQLITKYNQERKIEATNAIA